MYLSQGSAEAKIVTRRQEINWEVALEAVIYDLVPEGDVCASVPGK